MVDPDLTLEPTLSKAGEDQLPAGASTIASNKIYANQYDPDNPHDNVGVHFVALS